MNHYLCAVIIEGIVEHGNKVGTALGYPTANIGVGNSVPDGVWAAWIEVAGVRYGAMVSVGRRETIVKQGAKVLEVHLFNFTGDLYGKELKVELIEKVREQQKFESIEELREAINRDEIAIKKILTTNH